MIHPLLLVPVLLLLPAVFDTPRSKAGALAMGGKTRTTTGATPEADVCGSMVFFSRFVASGCGLVKDFLARLAGGGGGWSGRGGRNGTEVAPLDG
jgi:hypothetical protein